MLNHEAHEHYTKKQADAAYNKFLNQRGGKELAVRIQADIKAGNPTALSDNDVALLGNLSFFEAVASGQNDLRNLGWKGAYKEISEYADSAFLEAAKRADHSFLRNGKTYSASDVNYIDVGIVMALNGVNSNDALSLTSGWNIKDAVVKRGFGQLGQTSRGGVWVLMGYDHVNVLNFAYEKHGH